MVELNEYHKRRILVAFQRIDDVLSQSLHVLGRSQSDPQPRHVQDMSSAQIRRVEKHIRLAREQLNTFLERFHIDLPEPSTPLSWILQTNLTSLDITLEDLYPHKMRGYGEMDSVAASELTQTVEEVRKRVHQLLQVLDKD
jgi:hypothetical protein